ncbi:caspase family protein [Leadbettera azotonutricia]|uniref:Peptidase C14, caspase catalytic subunit p20 n=1 Tax=Leadbettera azotonutricia (strain ATCC BAA-888 / DSM 13862 / ZAS-9) TaxID=545695 RepID=F5Y6W7_LEAAZ|nr:caspase family protein [Leadbettera azotonutricia]AEF82332.1 peptidase C14, caspase catalytic subunit p20 [Leadbettera azotonutricia ZAS-9]
MKKPVIVLFFVLLAFPMLWAGERYALVIGNARYVDIESLGTPRNDAEDIAAALASLGFKVDLRLDAGIDEMEEAIYRFSAALGTDRENEGFFWYAGHGVQAEGENYLLPVDIRAERISQVRRMSYSLGDLLRELENARNLVNVVILDACRNNPLPGESRSLSRGLAAAPQVQDTFIMFSTATGATADDGTPGARNSPFTQAFLKHIATPAILESVAKEISRETIAITRTNQRPYISDNILYVKDYSLYPSDGLIEITRSVVPSVGAPRASAAGRGQYSLDNTGAWALSFSFAANPNTGFDALHPGAAVNYTFLERFLSRGALFIAPNAFFVSFQAGLNKFADNGDSFYNYMPGAGALWKFRPDANQRFFLSAGLSANVFLGSIHYSYNDPGFTEVDDFFVEPMIGFHGGAAFRFTPLLAVELNLGYYLDVQGPYPVQGSGSYSLNFLQGTLGLSVTLPYGKKQGRVL